jgi:HSP20 family molecular chaperone IbpA
MFLREEMMMISRVFFRATWLFVGMTFFTKSTIHAHRWGDGKYGCSAPSSNSCGSGTRSRHHEYSLSTFPRRYQYHRENCCSYQQPYNGRQRCTDTDLVSKIFSTPYYSNFGKTVNSLLRQLNKRVDMTTAMDFPCSVEDYGDAGIELLMELPGVDENDVSVELQDNVVVISVRRRHYCGCVFASRAEFSQSFQLGKDVNLDGIQVTLSSGILIVSIPRKPRVKHHRHHRILPIRNEDQENETVTGGSNAITEEKSKIESEHSATESLSPKEDDDFEIFDEEDARE